MNLSYDSPQSFYRQLSDLRDYCAKDSVQYDNYSTFFYVFMVIVCGQATSGVGWAEDIVEGFNLAYIKNNELTDIKVPYDTRIWNMKAGKISSMDAGIAPFFLKWAQDNGINFSQVAFSDYAAAPNEAAPFIY